ncbi:MULTISPECIES: LegC2/C7 family Dot/Icm T4SS effector [unclassified Legionella]|uniref:LegC2/C7 family Dot/Icm T4SS effector n=1 Tax=unclassified Legionella TaxID=2622702 RepID=UPI001055F0E8|nr:MULTISPECIES: LegC2/C7 family Dot/Icm T4SS effector [unclassified Legionella]MDI9819072.1 hypothetical protein [Legionella sp. PL877]
MIQKEEQFALNNASIESSLALSEQHPELTQIVFSQEQLGQLKHSLGIIIDTMEQNESLFSRVANFWGELPLWQKILGGIILTVPTLAVGLIAHITILLAISGATVAAYAASGIVLDDHHSCNKNMTDRLKQGIYSLADILEITITALDKIRKNLAEEIEKFRNENQRLINSLDALENQVDALTNQVEVLAATEALLRSSRNELETTAVKLKKTVADNEKLLKANQDELAEVKKDYERSKVQLTEKVSELAEVRVSMGLEIEKAKRVAATLQGTVQTLSGTVIEDACQRSSFQERLTKFLSDKEASFDSIANRICEAERELAIVKEELKQSNKRYESLLERQEKQVDRLEQLDRRADLKTPISQLGFYTKGKISADLSLFPRAPIAGAG